MIKILILTDNIQTWRNFLLNMINFDIIINRKNYVEMRNKLFSFMIRSHFPESLRGAAYSHVVLDKEIKAEDFYHLILPTIKQKMTQYGSRHILGE